MDEETKDTSTPETPAPLQPTPEQLAVAARAYYDQQWQAQADSARVAIARRTHPELFNDPSVQLNLEEIRSLVPLEGDTMRYAKGKDGQPRMAYSRHGMPSAPKAHGRKHPHLTPRQQAIKSTSIRYFRHLFNKRAAELQAEATASGEKYVGIPEAELTKLGARAAVGGMRIFKDNQKAKNKRARNRQKLSRRINSGVVPGNTNVRRYIG